jgi:hypothetical protein
MPRGSSSSSSLSRSSEGLGAFRQSRYIEPLCKSVPNEFLKSAIDSIPFWRHSIILSRTGEDSINCKLKNSQLMCSSILIVAVVLHVIMVWKTNSDARFFKLPKCTLPDIVHRNFPTLPHYVPDTLLFFQVYMFTYYIDNTTLFLHGIAFLFILRSMCIALTLRPTCVPSQLYIWTCYDLMFSGHTLVSVSLLCNCPNTILHIVLSVCVCTSLILSRFHYSDDVFVAGVIAVLFWSSSWPSSMV